MADKKLVLILNASQDYIKHTGDNEIKYAAEMNILFEAISETYIPLLNVFEGLEKDEVPFKVGLVLSPVLCTLLDDPVVQAQYVEWLDKRIALGKAELERNKNDSALLENTKLCFEKVQEAKISFERYGHKLLRKFHEYQKKGFVELLATCGTDIFLPHYKDMNEIINAQIETGIYAYRNFFGELPEGFWLPEAGYYTGFEKNLRAYGINYTVIDSRSFLFSKVEPEKGLFSPARFENALAVFGRDSDSDNQIFGDDGYSANSVYLDTNRDQGYDLPSSELKEFVSKGAERYSFGYKYWSKNVMDQGNHYYSYEKAVEQVSKDAETFINDKNSKLSKAQELLSDSENVSLVVTVSLNRLRSEWNEGILWIDNIFRKAKEVSLSFEAPKNLIGIPFKLQKIYPYFGSSSGVGYGEDLLSSKNNWMIRYVRKASERMVDLSERFPSESGLKARLLNLGAKELMLSQSCGWSKMIHNNLYSEYASMRFKQSINDFTQVFDALGSNTVSTEWLTNLENEHQLFPWMNYRIFSKKI